MGAALREPTPAQKEAGNYRKKHIRWNGLEISIENEAGTFRSGTDPDGKEWKTKIHYDYGYLKRTTGADGDHLDVFVGPDEAAHRVYVVNQVNPKTTKFDEHKVMLGFASMREARDAYLMNYEPGWNGLGSIKGMGLDEFKHWVAHGDTTSLAKSVLERFLKAGHGFPLWTIRPWANGRKGIKTPKGWRQVGAEESVKIVDVPAQDIVQAGDARKSLESWLKTLRDKPIRNQSTGYDVHVRGGGISKSISGSRAHAVAQVSAMYGLENLIKNAVRLAVLQPRKDKKNIVRLHAFYAPVRVGKAMFVARILVKERRDGKFFHDANLTSIATGSPPEPGHPLAGVDPGVETKGAMSIAYLARHVKPSDWERDVSKSLFDGALLKARAAGDGETRTRADGHVYKKLQTGRWRRLSGRDGASADARTTIRTKLGPMTGRFKNGRPIPGDVYALGSGKQRRFARAGKGGVLTLYRAGSKAGAALKRLFDQARTGGVPDAIGPAAEVAGALRKSVSPREKLAEFLKLAR